MPKVSVLMSVYNGERYLREAVESILNQTFTDFEFIIVDDGSTDGTRQILADYAERDSRIVLIRNEENIGLTKSLNKGLALARGEYIARQDADDISLPERLMREVAYLEEHPHVAMLGTHAIIINEAGRKLRVARYPTEDIELKWQLLFANPFCHTSVMLRHEIMKEVGFYRFPYAQDYDLWSRIAERYAVCNLPVPLVCFRTTQGNISTVRQKEQQNIQWQVSARNIRHIMGDGGIPDKEIYGLQVLFDGRAWPDNKADLLIGSWAAFHALLEAFLLRNHVYGAKASVWRERFRRWGARHMLHWAFALSRTEEYRRARMPLALAFKLSPSTCFSMRALIISIKLILGDAFIRTWRAWVAPRLDGRRDRG